MIIRGHRPNPPAPTVEAPADLRPAWERVAYAWLAREVDGGHQVDPAALAAEVSVNPRLAAELVQVLRVQRQRDPGLVELRARLVRDQITDAYLAREVRGGQPLDPAELARQVGTTAQVARQWLHALRTQQASEHGLGGMLGEQVSHDQPSPGAVGPTPGALRGWWPPAGHRDGPTARLRAGRGGGRAALLDPRGPRPLASGRGERGARAGR